MLLSPGFAGLGEMEVDMLREVENRDRKTYLDLIAFSFDSLGYHSLPSVNLFCD